MQPSSEKPKKVRKIKSKHSQSSRNTELGKNSLLSESLSIKTEKSLCTPHEKMSWRSYKKILLSRKRVESLKRPTMHISLYSKKEPKDSNPSSYTANTPSEPVLPDKFE